MSPRDQAKQFLRALFFDRYWPDPDLRLEVRCLVPERRGGGLGPRRWHSLTGSALGEAASDCHQWAADYEVYFGVLPRSGEFGDQEHVTYAGALWVDVDGGDGGPRECASLVKAANVPPPHLAVVSGGGLHCYWRLKECQTLCSMADREVFKLTLKRLVAAIGGAKPHPHADGARADCASILRVPGTFNHKQTLLRAVRMLHFAPEAPALPYSWWRTNLPALPVEVSRSRREEQLPSDGDRPGDDYNRRGDIHSLLEKHGWHLDSRRGEDERWSRPGKGRGCSATLHPDHGFYVFTSSAPPFEPGETYSPFACYALLEQAGDFRLAASTLAASGYGIQRTEAA